MVDIPCSNLKVKRFINTPVPSNTYLVIDWDRRSCIAIDPGSKKQDSLVHYLIDNNLKLDYVFLTHEHFDHCWGVNHLLEVSSDAKVVCTQGCAEWIKIPMNYFNKLYFDSDETYSIDHVDIIAEEIGMCLQWNNNMIRFIEAKGHTDKGMCISIGNALFTGDTIIKDTKPVIKKKYGASVKDLKQTIEHIYTSLPPDTLILAGHGDSFKLGEMESFYREYFKDFGTQKS